MATHSSNCFEFGVLYIQNIQILHDIYKILLHYNFTLASKKKYQIFVEYMCDVLRCDEKKVKNLSSYKKLHRIEEK